MVRSCAFLPNRPPQQLHVPCLCFLLGCCCTRADLQSFATCFHVCAHIIHSPGVSTCPLLRLRCLSASDSMKLLQRGGPDSSGSSQQQQQASAAAAAAAAAVAGGSGSNAWTDRRRWETDRTPGEAGVGCWCRLVVGVGWLLFCVVCLVGC